MFLQEHYEAYIRGVIRRFDLQYADVDDLAQDVRIKLSVKAADPETFSTSTHGDIDDEVAFKRFLARVTARTVLDVLRPKRTRAWRARVALDEAPGAFADGSVDWVKAIDLRDAVLRVFETWLEAGSGPARRRLLEEILEAGRSVEVADVPSFDAERQAVHELARRLCDAWGVQGDDIPQKLHTRFESHWKHSRYDPHLRLIHTQLTDILTHDERARLAPAFHEVGADVEVFVTFGDAADAARAFIVESEFGSRTLRLEGDPPDGLEGSAVRLTTSGLSGELLGRVTRVEGRTIFVDVTLTSLDRELVSLAGRVAGAASTDGPGGGPRTASTPGEPGPVPVARLHDQPDVFVEAVGALLAEGASMPEIVLPGVLVSIDIPVELGDEDVVERLFDSGLKVFIEVTDAWAGRAHGEPLVFIARSGDGHPQILPARLVTLDGKLFLVVRAMSLLDPDETRTDRRGGIQVRDLLVGAVSSAS